MFCVNCGASLPDVAKFCSGCGKQIDVPDAAPKVQMMQGGWPVEDKPTNISPEMQVLRIVALLVTGGVAVYMFSVPIETYWFLILAVALIITIALFAWPTKKAA
jgi:hypothetical protein